MSCPHNPRAAAPCSECLEANIRAACQRMADNAEASDADFVRRQLYGAPPPRMVGYSTILRDSVPDEVLEPLPPPAALPDHSLCGQAILAAVLAERARCRAVVLRLFGDDWRGNEALQAIGGEG